VVVDEEAEEEVEVEAEAFLMLRSLITQITTIEATPTATTTKAINRRSFCAKLSDASKYTSLHA